MKFFWKYIFPPIYGLFFYTIIRLVSDLTTEDKFWQRRLEQNLVEVIGTILLSYPMYRIPGLFVRKFEKRKSPNTLRSIALEFGEILLVAMLLATGVSSLIHVLAHDYPIGIDDLVIVNVLLSLFMLLHYAILRGNSLVRALVEQKVLIEKIRNDHLDTELKFLKAQYHPHFLFNALNTIYFQMDENVAGAKQSVEKFSELLRYQLYDQQQTVPVSQEIHYLDNFIVLQQTRSSEKLRLETRFDPRLDGQQVYPLLFLPLVENAFKYVGGDYQLKISADLTAEHIEFRVTNSLPAHLNASNHAGKGIGLENLRRRLELLYPGKHTLVAEKRDTQFSAVLTLQF
ncbi:sensor histidine kinase [Puia sp.]|jgi:sensor histidine kinase YesM|uniref:sensor histidine kinase n=1 Tax=Puia sp. TaxID=2045100 RepID=UPI002F41DEFE